MTSKQLRAWHRIQDIEMRVDQRYDMRKALATQVQRRLIDARKMRLAATNPSIINRRSYIWGE